ncbi:MAG: hypothetical protein WA172_00450 [Terriglobales bacterium]
MRILTMTYTPSSEFSEGAGPAAIEPEFEQIDELVEKIFDLYSFGARFGVKPGEVGTEFVFPHQENPLDYKSFVTLPNENFYLLDVVRELDVQHALIRIAMRRRCRKTQSMPPEAAAADAHHRLYVAQFMGAKSKA